MMLHAVEPSVDNVFDNNIIKSPSQIVIQRVGMCKKRTKVYDQEIKKLNFRRRKTAGLYQEVLKALNNLYNGDYKHKQGLLLANAISMMINVKVDRQSTRRKDGLICWFCENWDIIKDILPNIVIIDNKEGVNEEGNETERYIVHGIEKRTTGDDNGEKENENDKTNKEIKEDTNQVVVKRIVRENQIFNSDDDSIVCDNDNEFIYQIDNDM